MSSSTPLPEAATPPTPYVWKAILRTGVVYSRGCMYEGAPLFDPHKIEPSSLYSFEITPRTSAKGWMPISVLIPPGAKLEYALTREAHFCANGGKAPPSAFVAARVGYVLNGERHIKWAFPSGKVISHPGTYEEIEKEGLHK